MAKPGAKTKERKLKPLMVYLPDESIDRLNAHAQKEARRPGNMARRLIEEGLEDRDASAHRKRRELQPA